MLMAEVIVVITFLRQIVHLAVFWTSPLQSHHHNILFTHPLWVCWSDFLWRGCPKKNLIFCLTCPYIPEDFNLDIHWCHNLTSHISQTTEQYFTF